MKSLHNKRAFNWSTFFLLLLLMLVYLRDSDEGSSSALKFIIALFSPGVFAKGLNDLSLLTERKDSPGKFNTQHTNTHPLQTLRRMHSLLPW